MIVVSLIALCFFFTILCWFAVEVAFVSLDPQVDPGATGAIDNNAQFHRQIIDRALFDFQWRCAATAGSLIALGLASRNKSTSAAFTSFIVNSMLLFAWLPTHLFFVYQALESGRPSWHYLICNNEPGLTDRWCQLLQASAILSIIQNGIVLLATLFSMWQVLRALVTDLVPTNMLEKLTLLLIGCSMAGFIVWTCSSIILYVDFTDPIAQSFIFNDIGLRWNAPILTYGLPLVLGITAYSLKSGFTADRFSAMVANWLYFFLLFPAFEFVTRSIYEENVGYGCARNNQQPGLWDCQGKRGVAAGMGIVSGIHLLLGLLLTLYYMAPGRPDLQAIPAGLPADQTGKPIPAVAKAEMAGMGGAAAMGGPYAAGPYATGPYGGNMGMSQGYGAYTGYNDPTHPSTPNAELRTIQTQA